MTPKQRREAAMFKQQAIVNAAKSDGNRALTAEEQAQFNDLQREIDEAQAEIDSQERGLAGGAGAPSAQYPRETPSRQLQRQQERPGTAREPQQKRSVLVQRRSWRFAAILILTQRNTSATVPAWTRYAAPSLTA